MAVAHLSSVFQNAPAWRQEALVNIELGSKFLGNFPTIQFRKKRLTVAIHAQFDMECAEDVDQVKQRLQETLGHLMAEGEAKIAYTLSDL
jgi:hypothetical protein